MLAQLRRIGAPYGVDAVAGGGFDSVTDKWQIVQLVREAGVPFEVLHVGDLDQHGESIFEVLSEDVAAFDEYQGNITFTRIAVTTEQIALHNLPTDPIIRTSSRPKRCRPTCSPTSSTPRSASGSTWT